MDPELDVDDAAWLNLFIQLTGGMNDVRYKPICKFIMHCLRLLFFQLLTQNVVQYCQAQTNRSILQSSIQLLVSDLN